MAALTNYTNTDAVRAALGLDADHYEVPDTMMTNRNMDLELLEDLDGWLPTHATVWTLANAGSPTVDEARDGRRLQLYSMWFCAALLAEVWLAMPVMISDGQNRVQRFDIDLAKLRDMAVAHREKLKEELVPTVTAAVFVARVSPSYDPVSGDTAA